MKPLSWLGIVRLGLVQMALGSVVALTTTTFNRIMVVELALPAMLPGALVAVHYAMGMLRPRWGHGSDRTGRRTPWIIGGVAMLALGGLTAAAATALMETMTWPGIALATLGFLLIGAGVGCGGTALLALLSTRVAPDRRPAAATIVWLMMIFGIAVTAASVGGMLDPYSGQRLIAVTGGVAAVAMTLTLIAVIGVEGKAPAIPEKVAKTPFREALAETWAEPGARLFTIFIFVSMLAYYTQELILEPFAGHVFGMTVGETTTLSSRHKMGIFVGMVMVAVLGSAVRGKWFGSLKLWTVLGCLGSSAALAGLATAAFAPSWPLAPNVFALGFFNGVIAVAAIGSMMALAGAQAPGREGARMGLWGAAQAIAFGVGGLVGTAAVDGMRAVTGTIPLSYAAVFAVEAVLFLVSAWMALLIASPARRPVTPRAQPVRDAALMPGE
jgi:BCD family chlorophyll transporter-like MFS transporter